MDTKYTHVVNFYKNSTFSGWQYSSFRTTADALPIHLKKLRADQAEGIVRLIDVVELNPSDNETPTS